MILPIQSYFDSEDSSSMVDFFYGNGYLGTYIIRVCSYNVNCKFNNDEMYAKWLSSDNIVDIMAIGFQEIYFNIKDIFIPHINFDDKIAIAPHKRWIELFQSQNFIKDNYNLLLSKSFAGLCLFIYLRKQKNQNLGVNVTNLFVGSIPLGTLGLANKGALAISFRIGELNVCFINCHLPSGVDNTEKRLYSLQDVIHNLKLFQYNKGRKKKVNFMEADIDVVYLFGDLNFRLQKINFTTVINKLNKGKKKAINQLMQYDELIILRESNVLYRSFHEGEIEFQPTYKYLVNSNIYVAKRVPSFCDRILWMGNACLNISYRSFPEFTFSDHKPISADFLIDTRRLKKKSSKFVKLDQGPRIRIKNTVMDFGDVYFMKYSTCETKITNVGKTPGEILFRSIETHKEMPTWVTIIPPAFSLEPKQSKVVQFRIYIDSNHVANFNRNTLKLNGQIICVSVINGMDTPLMFSGDYHVNIFGIHLELLRFIDKSIDNYKPKDIEKLEIMRQVSFSHFQQNNLLKRILNTLLPRTKHNESFADIILQKSSNMKYILELIELTNNQVIVNPHNFLKKRKHNIAANVETFLIYMKSLPQPIIPFVIQARLSTKFNDKHHIVKVLGNLPKVNILFIRQMINYFNGFVKKHNDGELITNLIVSCIPPSTPALKGPLTVVMSTLINKPDMF